LLVISTKSYYDARIYKYKIIFAHVRFIHPLFITDTAT